MVAPSTPPIWASSQEAPSATQLPRALSTLSTPNPATWDDRADPATLDAGRSHLADRAEAGVARADAAEGHEARRMAGRASEHRHVSARPGRR